ncbi:hypothetical protein FPY71_07330 [Aureimonas fodinaquatilis]|uniref:Uncharacterized protein n=1 Tax=Aureimonas fodinaquatilis TaxID=2565783 RepID=A0A5B0DYQ6_9HYPH|nr:hypothetical protein [Aureimonas fodinaquatilis]KAA0970329.1 hypothetical protein FPY71_07330 [Aureimonas fodinaquatilis]
MGRYPRIHPTLFHIERELDWQEKLLDYSTTLATSDCVYVIRGAWEAAVKQYPNHTLYLQNGARIMQKHSPEEPCTFHPKVIK